MRILVFPAVLILFSAGFLGGCAASPAWNNHASNVTGILDHHYDETVDSNNPRIYYFSRAQSSEKYVGALRITISSSDAEPDAPLLIIIKRQRSVQSWQLPLVMDEIYPYNFVSRTLCPLEYHGSQTGTPSGEQFFVEIMTLSDTIVRYTLIVETFPQFHVAPLPSFVLKASPSQPQYVHYKMRQGIDRVLVKARSLEGNTTCAFLSIQSVRCPVGELHQDLRLDGRYQSVTTSGAIEISRKEFPDGQFYIAVLVKPHDDDCQESRNLLSALQRKPESRSLGYLAPRYKSINVTVVDSLDANQYALATTIPIAVFLLFFIFSLVFLQTGPRTWVGILCHDLNKINLPHRERKWLVATLFEKSVTGKSVPFMWDPDNYQDSHIVHMMRRLKTESQLSLDKIDGVVFTDYLPEETRVDLTTLDMVDGNKTGPSQATLMRITDHCKKSAQLIQQTSREYGCSLLTVFIFYSLPVLQLVMTHQGLLYVTGNEDICYYNFSCSNTVGILSDFNHIISNIGYAMLGILFLLMVRRKSVFTEKLRQSVPNLDKYGTPSQIGLFYGMGLALTMEGFMSACYHVCPSYNNFQFDTAFMYLIAGLLLLKLYHGRHPDVLPQSYYAYAFFAGFIFIAVVGVIARSIVTWIVFSVFHGLLTIFTALQIAFVGYLELSFGGLKRGLREAFSRKREHERIPQNRIILSSLVGVINLGFAVTGPWLQPFDFASHLLFILQANLVVYAGFYLMMKAFDPDERISRITCVYFLLATPSWVVGMYYFMQGLTNWGVSAALSREGNRECFFFNFYDEHDVWHMCSAVGLFFTFMMLLSLDDDRATVLSEKIMMF